MSYQDDEIHTLRGELEELAIRLAAAQHDAVEAWLAADQANARVEIEVDRRHWLERRIEAARNALGP